MRTIDFEDFLDVTEKELPDTEKNIIGNEFYLAVYRIRKKYGFGELTIRGSYDDIAESKLLENYKDNYSIKESLFSFEIMFSENTTENISGDSDNRRELIILDEWTTFADYQKLIEDKLEFGDLKSRPTDIMIEKEMSNRDTQNVYDVLQRNGHNNVTLWFVQKEKDVYTSIDEKHESVLSKFNKEEIEDVFLRIEDIYNTEVSGSSLVDELVKYGSELYNNGIKCLVYNGENIMNATSSHFFDFVSAFLVYMSEAYGMTISTVHDSIFSKVYSWFCKFNYASATDLFYRRFRYFPMMYNVHGSSMNMLFIRDVIQEYDSYFVPMDDLEKMLIGDTTIKMNGWATSEVSRFQDYGYINKLTKEKKLNPRLYDTMLTEDIMSSRSYTDVPIRDIINDEEKVKSIVTAFNEYNVRSGMNASKIITTRDLLCRVKQVGDSEQVYVGFIANNRDFLSGGRLFERVIISKIDSKKPYVDGNYFSLGECPLTNLYSLNYIYDFTTEAPRGLYDLAIETGSYQNYDEVEIDEDELVGSVERKFLYYICTNSTYTNSRIVSRIMDSLDGDKAVYRDSCFSSVIAATELVNNFKGKFQLRNLVESGMLTPYGDIDRSYIGYAGERRYFKIKNGLFGNIKLG